VSDEQANLGLPREDVTRLYRARFSPQERRAKEVVWGELARSFFQRYVDPGATIMDLGPGSCEFINAIQAKRKIAVDINPDSAHFLADGEFVQTSTTDLSPIDSDTVDVVFTSNFFEHLPDTSALLDTLDECRRVLVPSGRLIVVMPNIRYVRARYWDYLDHRLPLTHLSLVEALELSGFIVDRVVPRFLPYTVKGSRVPVTALAVRVYLRLRPVWKLLGRQMLVIAHAD
jgi:SAM-dependent methyltransferase